MTLRDILTEWLKAHHYDGLYDDEGECGCELSDIMPCDEPGMRCSPGVKVPCDGTLEACSLGVNCKWHMVAAEPCKHGIARDCAECRAEKRARAE